jgi:maleylpyruvate isomerase
MDTSTAMPQLDATVLATTRYLQALTVLTDEDVRAPSGLPRWTRGHVITHLARNADGLTRLLHWAMTGVESPMYASDESRDADIEAGAGRSAEELREDSAAAWGRLLQAANELHASQLDHVVTRTPGAPGFPVSKVGGMRRTEVEIHHADLDIGYTANDWPADFTRHMIKRRQNELADDGPSMVLVAPDVDGLWKFGEGQGPEITGSGADLAWWLLGRGTGDGLGSSTGELPSLPRWR